jgi:2-oxoglutarate ferredoxin oxidoreductase subunit delta
MGASFKAVGKMVKKTARGKIVIDRERCKGCHICVDVCPTQSIEIDESLNKKGYFPARCKEHLAEGEKGCTGCAQCATVCPEVAIEVYRAQ